MFQKIAAQLKSLEDPLVITHVDADGITSGSIIFESLNRLDRNPEFLAVKQLDEQIIEEHKDRALVFTDLGSGMASQLPANSVVIDHHEPDPESGPRFHLNAHLLGIDGSSEINSAGLSWLVAKELGFDDLLPLAIVGAVGDLQDRAGGLKGRNKEIAKYGVKKNLITARKGLSFFGRETRALAVFLEYASDPYIPGLTGRSDACLQLLESCGISLFDNNWRTYHDLTQDEQKRLITAVHIKAIQAGLEPWKVKSLVRKYYVLHKNPVHTELRDATEFATLLNACGRNGRPEVGLGICTDPDNNYTQAKSLLAYHRKQIAQGIEEILERGADPAGKNVSVFWSEEIKPTIIGIIVGMGVGAGLIDGDKVLAGAVADGDNIKVSLRMPQHLLRKGVDLAQASREAAEKVGGRGGGHNIAAGAEIPEDKLSLFLIYLDKVLSAQLSSETNKIIVNM